VGAVKDEIPCLLEPAFPIVVSGPSGVGKTVLCRRLCRALPWVVRSVSATTRSRRGNEKNRRHYFFLGRDAFLAKRAEGGFVEWAQVHDNLYGTPRSFLQERLDEGKSVVLNIDVQGGLLVREAYPEALLVFVLPPSMEDLERRLRKRATDSDEVIRRRLETARQELLYLSRYDAVLINGLLDDAVRELIAIVRGERARVARRFPPPAEP
jgi:guanylate kinase